LTALDVLWAKAKSTIPRQFKIVRVGVTLGDLTDATARQLDMLLNDDPERQKWESVTTAMDSLNSRYGKSFTRIPRAEDFW